MTAENWRFKLERTSVFDGAPILTTDMRRIWIGGLLSLSLLRLVMAWLLLNDVPKLLDHNGWYFHTGGDQSFYFALAQSIAAGTPAAAPSTAGGAGLPLLMAALLRLTGGTTYFDILPYLVILNGFVLGSASIWVIGQLAYLFTGSRIQGLLTAGALLVSPYLLWLAFFLHPQGDVLQSPHVPRQMWMNGITDSPSLFLVMFGALLMMYGVNSARGTRLWILCLAGAWFGLSASIRIHTLPMSAVAIAALAWRRQWRDLVFVSAGFLAGFLPQLIYNAVTTNSAVSIPYAGAWLNVQAGSVHFDYKGTPFAPQFLFYNLYVIIARRRLLGVALEVVIFLCALYAFIKCWKLRDSLSAMVMFGMPAASFMLHVSTYVYADDPVRFTIPALTIGVPAIIYTFLITAAGLQSRIEYVRYGKAMLDGE